MHGLLGCYISHKVRSPRATVEGDSDVERNADDTFKYSQHVLGIFGTVAARNRHFADWCSQTPTRALSSLGVSLDDWRLVQLLEEIDAMDQPPVPVTARDVMSTNVMTIAASFSLSTRTAAQVLAEIG